MQSAYYLHINQAVDHERTVSQPNAALSQEKHSVIIIHQCYDVVIDYNIFLLPLGSPSPHPAPGTLDRLFFSSPKQRNHGCSLRLLFRWSIDSLFRFQEVFQPRGNKANRETRGRAGLARRKACPSGLGVLSLPLLPALGFGGAANSFQESFLIRQNAATSVPPCRKVGTKAVWLLYLGAK